MEQTGSLPSFWGRGVMSEKTVSKSIMVMVVDNVMVDNVR